MILSHRNIQKSIKTSAYVPQDIIDMDCVYRGAKGLEITVTTTCKMYVALVLHKHPLNWNEAHWARLRILNEGTHTLSFDIDESFSHVNDDYVYRIWTQSFNDGIICLDEIRLDESSFQTLVPVNHIGLIDGDVLHYNKISNTLESKQISYRRTGSHDKPNFIIALTGQSNAQGYGGIYSSNIKDDAPHNRIFAFNIWSKEWEIADLRKHIGTKPPLWQCLAFHFAKKLVEGYPDIRVGIINYGVSGQPISRWVKFKPEEEYSEFNETNAENSGAVDYGEESGNYMPGAQGDIFDAHVRNINDAMNLLDEENKKIDVICWHQGESNGGISSFHEKYYETSLNRVIGQYRSLEYCNSKTPFIVGETTGGDVGSYKGWEARNIELRYMNIDADPYTKCVQSMDLEVSDKEFNNGDIIHFSSQSHRILGKRYFEAFRSIE